MNGTANTTMAEASNYFNHPPLAKNQVQQERTEVTEIDVAASVVE